MADTLTAVMAAVAYVAAKTGLVAADPPVLTASTGRVLANTGPVAGTTALAENADRPMLNIGQPPTDGRQAGSHPR